VSPHRIEVRPAARQALLGLSKPTRRRLQHTVDSLAEQPRPQGATELSGAPGVLKLRVGTHELIYTARDNVILIIDIAHRSSPWHNQTHNPRDTPQRPSPPAPSAVLSNAAAKPAGGPSQSRGRETVER
jgi:mRNA interferase RelE/StbE